MIRKQNRQRRDYLYRRAQLLKDAEISEKRALLRASLASGKPLAQQDVDEQVRKDYAYDESRNDLSKDEAMDLDDEYSELSGIRDPQILVTTSRDPSTRLSAFSKEIRLLFPTAIRLNRGNLVLPDLVSAAKSNEQSDVVLLHEHRGQPSAITISHFPHGPTLSCSLHNVVLRHSIPNTIRGTVSESYPHLIFEGFKSPLGLRIVKILKHLFPPRDPTVTKAKLGNRVVSFVAHDDFITIRHHVYVRTSSQNVELSEVGPRMTMRPFSIKNCTLEDKNGDVEWNLNNYTRTARKKELL